jgi:cytochrome c553
MFALWLMVALQSAAPAADRAAGASVDGAAIEAAARDCRGCHVLDHPMGSPPIIDGQHAGFLAAQLRAFRDRHRDAFPMGMLSEGLGEDQILALSALLATQPWPAVDHALSAAAIDAGKTVATEAACSVCHGQSWRGGGDVPRVAGQVPSYLARQLRAMTAGRRAHPPMTLDASEVNAVAAFLAAQR